MTQGNSHINFDYLILGLAALIVVVSLPLAFTHNLHWLWITGFAGAVFFRPRTWAASRWR